MFEAHFGFHHTPFGKDLLPEQLYSSTAFRELKERLRYAIERVRIMAVTGEVGAGKSTTLRAVTAQLPTALYRFMYLPKPINSPRDLFRELLQVLRIDPPWMAADARLRLREALETMKRDGLTPVLIQDEAQALTGATLEELRMLTSFDMDARPVFAMVLCGQPELNRILANRSQEALAQRITVRYHLVGMEREETRAYVEHHLKLVGVDRPIFDDTALQHLFEFSHGLPRLVNRYALQALELAWRQGLERVDLKTMEMATAF
ncbi:MAG: AAA family ATPase [Kiritimatiellia bacterium]|jgi:general secretion pathway protein A